MDDHLAKPFDPATLLATVARAATARHGNGTGSGLVSRPTPGPVYPGGFGSELPVVEPMAFQRTASFLAPASVASYLQAITARGEALARDLRAPEALAQHANELAKAAHTLAGSVSLFGFERLAGIGLRFERAVQIGATELPALVDPLSGAIEATLQEIRARMAQTATA